MCVPEEVGNLSKANISVSHLCGSLQMVAEKQKARRRILKSLESLSQAAGIPLCPWLGRRDARLYWVLGLLTPPLRMCTFSFPTVLRAPEHVGEASLVSCAPQPCREREWSDQGFPRAGLLWPRKPHWVE